MEPGSFSSCICRSPSGQMLQGCAGSHDGAACGCLGLLWLWRSRAGEPPSGVLPACFHSRPQSMGGLCPSLCPGCRQEVDPQPPLAPVLPSTMLSSLPLLLPYPLTQSLTAGPLTSESPPRLTPQTTEGPNPVQFQPKAALGHGLPGPISRQCPLATGEGLAPKRGTGSSIPRWEEGECGGEQLRAKTGPLLRVLFSQCGLGPQGQQLGKEHLG